MIIESQFSEFSYGYALTEHYARLLWPRMFFAPRFPTLRRESGLGYDVRISGFGFLQFKRANGHDGPGIMERPKKFGFSRSSVVYRMRLSASGVQNQHQKLLRLETLVGSRASVFYACPAFAKNADFNDAYLQQSVPDRSMFIRPSAIGQIPDARHHISFNPDSLQSGFAWCFSEPTKIKPTSASDVMQEFSAPAEQPPISTDTLGELVGHVSKLYNEYGYSMPELPTEPSPRRRLMIKLTVMLRAGFDIEPLFFSQALKLPKKYSAEN